jgi:predicted TIM-barrel fold metal-dependent hydrolase
MREIGFATATATAYNNWLEAEYTKKDKRLYGVGLMPIENPEGAIAEMRRCKQSRKNFVAMLLPSVTASGKTYGDPSFWPVYAEAERLGMVPRSTARRRSDSASTISARSSRCTRWSTRCPSSSSSPT